MNEAGIGWLDAGGEMGLTLLGYEEGGREGGTD